MKKKRIQILLITLILTMISGCKKVDSYLYYNKNYYSIFHYKNKIYNKVKKSFYRSFFKVNEINIDSFSSITNEIDERVKGDNSLIFLEDFTTPGLIKNSKINSFSKINLLTYNLNDEDMVENKNISTFNVQIDPEIISKRIIKLFKKHSKTRDFTDCGIIINNDYILSNKVSDKLKEFRGNIDIFYSQGDEEDKIKSWLGKKDYNVIALFSSTGNGFILNLQEDEFNNVIFIELITDYGIITNKIKYKINIYWDKAFDYALNSSKFKEFIELSGSNTVNKRNFTYEANYNNIVTVKKYRDKKNTKSVRNEEKTNKK